MSLSNHTSEVVGFDSTIDSDKQVYVQDKATSVMENNVETLEKSTSTKETKEIGVS
jgi:hypothetical protein